METAIMFVWGVFAAIFFYLAYSHWRNAQETIRPFKIRGMGEAEGEEPMPEGMEKYLDDFNSYMGGINSQYQKRNNSAAIGYFIAGSTSLISLILFLYK